MTGRNRIFISNHWLNSQLTFEPMKATTKPRVKICCMASIEEAWMAIEHGASALRLVSEMPSLHHAPSCGGGTRKQCFANQLIKSLRVFLLGHHAAVVEHFHAGVRVQLRERQRICHRRCQILLAPDKNAWLIQARE